MPKPIKRCVEPKVINDLRHLIVSNAEVYGDKPLYTYKENKEIKVFTHNDQLANMNRLGTAFAKLGIMGKTVAVIGETHPAYMTTYYTTINGGGVIVPLDRELELEQVANFCTLAEVEAIVYTKGFNTKLLPLVDKMPGVKYFIPIHDGEDTEDERVRTYSSLLEMGQTELDAGNREYLDYEIELNKLCAILFTSGTTGTSKGVMLSHKNLTAATNSSCQSMECDYTNTFVSVLPIHHTYECTCAHLALSNIGGSVYINDGLKNTMKSFAYFKPNTLVLVPLYVETMYKRIWAEIDKKGMTRKVKFAMKLSNLLLKVGIDLRDKFFAQIKDAFGGNLRSIICGGAPLSPQLVKDFETFGITIVEGYGITECAPLVAVNRTNNIILHSVGHPVVGCTVKIDKSPEEETGEILVKGDNVMMGYYKNPEATAEVFTEDGFFRTGDIGFIDKKGAIHITGRKKNVIILSNGKNVFPEEVEEHLASCDRIAECVVIGRKNANGEIVITAVVYPNFDVVGKDTPVDEIREAVKEQVFEVNRNLPSFKQVREIEIRTEEFEKTTSRKIKRFLIK
ncbi:MAG: long-chain fatty acid--CoA ligase [Ruminococcaceae bacterium]|nr:long-chain fatty acid--CoA ligase [Oscillospiraceae bacterium]